VRATAENLKIWERRIKERVQAGMTIEDWCHKSGVSIHQYHYWNKRVRKNQKAGEEIGFTDVSSILSPRSTAGQNPRSASDFRILFKGVQVTMPETFNPAALTGLIKVLREL
jgi:hypothetical protein